MIRKSCSQRAVYEKDQLLLALMPESVVQRYREDQETIEQKTRTLPSFCLQR